MPGLVRKSGGDAGLFDTGLGVDIGVSMRAGVLEHKKRDGMRADHNYCFWSMRRIPDEVRAGSKLWVASGGRWRGYFVVKAVDPIGEEDASPSIAARFDGKTVPELQFFSDTWHEADGGPRSPFQGFTYNVPEGFT